METETVDAILFLLAFLAYSTLAQRAAKLVWYIYCGTGAEYGYGGRLDMAKGVAASLVLVVVAALAAWRFADVVA